MAFNKLINCMHLTLAGDNIVICSICKQPSIANREHEFIHHLRNVHGISVSRMEFGFYSGVSYFILHRDAFMLKIPINNYMLGFVDNENDLDHIFDEVVENFSIAPAMAGEKYSQKTGEMIQEIIMRENYSCSVCGGEYDSVSEDILKAHIDQCLQAVINSHEM